MELDLISLLCGQDSVGPGGYPMTNILKNEKSIVFQTPKGSPSSCKQHDS